MAAPLPALNGLGDVRQQTGVFVVEHYLAGAAKSYSKQPVTRQEVVQLLRASNIKLLHAGITRWADRNSYK
jgi:hypothetical protein